jgi:hypothetical protein
MCLYFFLVVCDILVEEKKPRTKTTTIFIVFVFIFIRASLFLFILLLYYIKIIIKKQMKKFKADLIWLN